MGGMVGEKELYSAAEERNARPAHQPRSAGAERGSLELGRRSPLVATGGTGSARRAAASGRMGCWS